MQAPRANHLIVLTLASVTALHDTGSAAAGKEASRPGALRRATDVAAAGGLGDYNGDGVVDLFDFDRWPACLTGPGGGPILGRCEVFDADHDEDVDHLDAQALQGAFGANKGPPSDSCATPTPIIDGFHAFNNNGATLDGPAEPEMCDFFGYTQIESDVWFCYQASCSGEAVVSLCGSDYDTKMAVYDGCNCPTVPPVACSDDDCGDFTSRVVFQAVEGQSYLLRIGGFEGAQGPGLLNVRCGVEVCGPGRGDCFAAAGNGTRGCDDAECCQTTCTVDPFCCDVDWDDFCAAEAEGLCTGSFPACTPDAGPCETGHAEGSGGCSDVECCNTVCTDDPFCCVDTWDDLCATSTLSACFYACGAGSGDCLLPNGSPGCEDQTCCETVCARDSFCCEVNWDESCVDLATTDCP